MKLPFTLAILLLLSFALPPAVSSQKVCSCTASCTANVSCSRRGCTAICGTRDACYAACGNDLLVTRFNLRLDNASGQQVAAALSDRTGHKIEFTPFPRSGNSPFDVDVKDADMWNTMDRLSKRGTVTVDGVEWKKYQRLRSAALAGNRLSVRFNDISVGDALSHLSFLTGWKLKVKPEDAEKIVSISQSDITIKDAIERIRQQAGVKIERAKK